MCSSSLPPGNVPPVITPPMLTYATPKAYEIPEGWTEVEVFGLRAETLAGYLTAVVLINIGMSLVFGIALALLAYWFANGVGGVETGGVILVLSLGQGAYGAFRDVRKTRREWESYRLVVANEGLIHSRPPENSITVLSSSVRRIVEEYDAYRIEMSGSHLRVSKRMEQPERVRERLEAWQPIQGRQSRLALAGSIIFNTLLPLVCMISTLVSINSSDVRVVAVCIATAIILGIVITVRAWRNRTLSKWTKIGSIVILLIALLLPLRLVWLIFHW